jgi:hypothetical protein
MRRGFGVDHIKLSENIMPDEIKPDAELIAEFSRENEVPQHISKWLDMCAKDRKYVNDDCIRKPNSHRYAVTTNHILINQRVVTASIYARDPAMRFDPLPQMWGQKMVPDPMTGMPTIVESGPPDEMVGFAKTLDIATAWTLRENNFKEMFTGLLQDVQTNNLMWIKIIPQEDYFKDPLGQCRMDDMMANMGLYKSLKQRETDGDLAPECADYKRMKDVEATIREFLADQLRGQILAQPLPPMQMEVQDPMTGMVSVMEQPTPDPRQDSLNTLTAGGSIPDSMIPETLSYVGVCYDVFYPEDVLLDWSLFRPEDWHKGKHVTFKLKMSQEEVCSKYTLTKEEATKLTVCNHGNKKLDYPDIDPDDRHSTTSNSDGIYATLYERYDRDTSRRYVWAEGVDRFLVNEAVRVSTPWWFPALPITKNRVTGRIVGPSDVTLQRPLQDEINEQRSHARKIKRACIPKTIVGPNMLEKGEKEKLENGDGYCVVTLKHADKVKEAIASTTPPTINPWLTDASEAKFELQKVSGVSNTASGVVGDANLATEVADARQSLDALTAFYRSTMVDWTFERLGYATAWILAQIWKPEHAMAVCGPGAIWHDQPQSRVDFLRRMQLKVEPGSSGRPGGEAYLKKAMMIVDIARGLGLQAKSPAIISDILRESGLNIDPEKYFMLSPAPLPPSGQISSSQGEGGGAPPMADSPTRGMESVPNGPDSNPLA